MINLKGQFISLMSDLKTGRDRDFSFPVSFLTWRNCKAVLKQMSGLHLGLPHR